MDVQENQLSFNDRTGGMEDIPLLQQVGLDDKQDSLDHVNVPELNPAAVKEPLHVADISPIESIPKEVYQQQHSHKILLSSCETSETGSDEGIAEKVDEILPVVEITKGDDKQSSISSDSLYSTLEDYHEDEMQVNRSIEKVPILGKVFGGNVGNQAAEGFWNNDLSGSFAFIMENPAVEGNEANQAVNFPEGPEPVLNAGDQVALVPSRQVRENTELFLKRGFLFSILLVLNIVLIFMSFEGYLPKWFVIIAGILGFVLLVMAVVSFMKAVGQL